MSHAVKDDDQVAHESAWDDLPYPAVPPHTRRVGAATQKAWDTRPMPMRPGRRDKTMAKKSRDLHLGALTFPEEVVTETIAILGKRGVGKTTTARVLTEQLISAGLPVVVLDPTGVWWGLRSSADGQHDGLPVVIFGGDHADVPLEPSAGALIADVIVDERISALLDLSHLSKTAMRTFTATFLEHLYRRNRDPLHLVLDEADLFAPQRLPAGAERLLGAMDDIVRRGRVRGLGVTMITQRPQVLNKDVLSQVEVLIALRMVGTRDVAAIDDWIRLHADEDEAKTVKASLPSLPVGTAWVWSPGWLGLLERVEIPTPVTYDSSATPKPGQRRTPVKRMAEIDLAALGVRIQETMTRVAENDPRTLRATIARLEKDLRTRPEPAPAEPRVVEVRVVDDDTISRLRAVAEALSDDLAAVVSTAEQTRDQVGSVLAALATVRSEKPPVAAPATPPAATPQQRPTPTLPVVRDRSLPKAERLILSVLTRHGNRTTVQVAIGSGYSHKSGGFRNALSSLRTAGYIDGRGDVSITDAGRDALATVEPLPTGSELRHWWMANKLGKAERLILEVLAAAWPAEIPTEHIAELADYSPTSGGFRNALSRLRSLELAAGRGALTINPDLVD